MSVRSQRLPGIEQPSEGSARGEKWSYSRAASELKEVSRRVEAVKNHLNFLLAKQEQALSPHARLQEEKEARLRTAVHEEQRRLREQLSLRRLKAQSEAEVRQRSNQVERREAEERRAQARREAAEGRKRAHREVAEQSLANLRAINGFRSFFRAEKQNRRELLFAQEQEQRKHVRVARAARAEAARTEGEEAARAVWAVVERKRAELRRAEEECRQFEQLQEDRLARQRERRLEKVQRLKRRRLLTLETTSTQGHKLSPPSTSPHSWASFVVIS